MAPCKYNVVETYDLLAGPKANNLITTNDTYISLTGSVVFKNEFGYLNAELYPLVKFYLFAIIAFGLITVGWMYLLKEYN